ncbi:MAG: S8 family serine peptidase [Candidatus Eiseniibacteriota bacterium]|nr:MAG: S8 family serine peptidase [Candidatus Eisenbacteria bacterium]
MKMFLSHATAPRARRIGSSVSCAILLAAALLVAAPSAAAPDPGSLADSPHRVWADPSGFDSSPYALNHTTSLPSRPGIRFVKGLLVVELAESPAPEFAQGRRLSTGLEELDRVLEGRGLKKAERLFPWDCEKGGGGHCNFFRLTFPESSDLALLMRQLGEAQGVNSVQPVGLHPVDHYPNDFWFAIQWPLNQREDHDMNAPECWDVEKGDSSIVVAVIDTGVDWEHPDLGGVAPFTGGSIWANWSEFYGTEGSDDDGNGFIDDVRGWDFVHNVAGHASEDLYDEDNDPMDFHGHGTHVAGIVAAVADNTEGVAGLAYGCKVMPLRAGWHTGSTGVVRMDFCAQGVFYAARNGARVINCSWANDSSGGLSAAADTAIARGAIIVVSAGNSGSSSQAFNYLSTRGDCFAVGATDSNDVKYSLSNYGTWVHFCAPGVSVASTYRTLGGSHQYALMTGTSMAAPYVSALSALLLSQEPSWSRTQVRTLIRNTCDSIDDLNPGYAGLLGGGRINAYAALSWGSGNWQARTGGEVTGSPLPFEDGSVTYVAVTGADNCLHVLDSSGVPVVGWPRCVAGEPTSPAAGDIDGDSDAEILVGTQTGTLHAWEASGASVAGWPVALGEAVVSGPLLCDIDEDSFLEVFCATADSVVHAFRGDGSVQPGWPVAVSGAITSEPCYALLGADTARAVVVATSDSRLNALTSDGTQVAGWPITLGSPSPGSPVGLDMDGDGRSEIFVGAPDGTVYGVDDDGAVLGGWPRSTGGGISRSVGLGDVDGDDVPDVVAGASDGRVYAWALTGSPLSGWPAETGAAVVSSPSLVDLDGDGAFEVAVGSDDRDLHLWSGAMGQAYAGWPRSTGGTVRSSPCFWDFDGDGSLEVAVGSGDRKIHFWNIPGSVAADSLLAWPMYRHDSHRSGNSGFEVELPAPPVRPSLAVNVYPNPFAGTVTFECLVEGAVADGKRGVIRIYDVSGRRVGEIPVNGSGGTLNLTWDGINQAARKLASGVYFYSAEVDGLEKKGKVVFLKQ